MRPNDPKPLTVYKASAGSGKTFTLAVEYITLLIADPTNYRYTLAVTFTNKATQEMKSRILSQLYGIAHGLKDSQPYMAMIRRKFAPVDGENLRERNFEPSQTAGGNFSHGKSTPSAERSFAPGNSTHLRELKFQPTFLDDREIRRRAGVALDLLVHNYNFFRVETIDSFFQSVLRNLARELGLTANLTVGLNDDEVEGEAVDSLIEDIQPGDKLLGWIMDFIGEKLQDDKNWNVIGQIKAFGMNIFKDYYKDHQQELHRIMSDPSFFKEYTGKLQQTKRAVDAALKAYAERYAQIALRASLTDDNYSRGHQNVPGYFERLEQGKWLDEKFPNSYVLKGLEDPEKLLKKADIGTAAGRVITEEVAPLLKEAEEYRRRQVLVVNTINLTLRNINELRLLGRIEEAVRDINAQNNNYPLSGTQNLLQSLIDDQDSPFIYEKIGGQLRYIMIDEFQDTSTVQWENFKVLLDDCIAHQAGSLIVGDVKQSIYRWRSGDWHLLQGLKENNTIGVKILETNWRSMRNIVSFNNNFFTIAAQLASVSQYEELKATGAPDAILREALEIKDAYSDVAQQVPEKRGHDGLVEIRLIPKKDYEDNMIRQVQDVVEQLLSQGIPQRKIAVLVRSNKNIQALAEYFQQNEISVNGEPRMVNMVSDEAFRLSASLAVTTIVTAMHVLTHPDDRLAKAALLKAYCKVNDKDATDTTLYLAHHQSTTDAAPAMDILDVQLPEAFVTGRETLLATPLIDLAEQLYEIFGLAHLTGQSAYMCAFFDQLSTFMKDHVASIDDFLDEWDTTLSKKSIHSDDVDGIRLLTIHKSKGLEFDNVIIPWCDWPVEMTGEVLWVNPTKAPFNELPVVPVSLSAKVLKQSFYRDDYASEHLKNIVDNLNVLYVAFTRAGRNLFIIGKDPVNYKKKGVNDSFTPSQLINDVLDRIALDAPVDDSASEDAGRLFRYGTLSLSEAEKEKQTDNIFLRHVEGQKVTIRNYKLKAFFRQSNDSADFITPADEAEEQEQRRAYIETGNILHALFAAIRTTADIDRAIDQMEFDGVLYDKPMTRKELKQLISSRMQHSDVARWFAPGWQVMSECSILVGHNPDGTLRELRPDRVITNGQETLVIDFKTGRQREEHQAQVRGYMQQLEAMGYTGVRGYLWYIRTNTVVPVTAGAFGGRPGPFLTGPA